MFAEVILFNSVCFIVPGRMMESSFLKKDLVRYIGRFWGRKIILMELTLPNREIGSVFQNWMLFSSFLSSAGELAL